MQELFLFICLLSLGLSTFTLIKLFNVSVEIESFKKSTHTIQYVGTEKNNVAVKDNPEDFAIRNYNKEYNEASQVAFPEFATFEEDLELKGL